MKVLWSYWMSSKCACFCLCFWPQLLLKHVFKQKQEEIAPGRWWPDREQVHEGIVVVCCHLLAEAANWRCSSQRRDFSYFLFRSRLRHFLRILSAHYQKRCKLKIRMHVGCKVGDALFLITQCHLLIHNLYIRYTLCMCMLQWVWFSCFSPCFSDQA